jgi:hypothetical protein
MACSRVALAAAREATEETRNVMAPHNEPSLWANTRTFPAEYASAGLAELRGAVRVPGQQLRGYIHDALLLAFEAGEDQGECRAIRILAIAKANATSEEARVALDACLRLLAPQVGARDAGT